MPTPALIRVFTKTPRPSAAILGRFANVPTCHICDAMDHFGALDYRIRPLDPAMKCCGPALTVRTRPCDNLALYQALNIAKPGDVMVISTYGHLSGSTLGDLVVNIAKRVGLAGVVCDGLCRDQSGIRALGLPVFVRGACPASPFKDGPAEINGPISCGGVAIRPGDIIAADEDGIAVIPLTDADHVAVRLEEVRKKEETMLAEIESGQVISKSVAARLKEVGVSFVDAE